MAISKLPIRILNVFTIMNRGGSESMIMNYYRNLDRSKVQFDFLVHRPEKGAFEDEILALGGKIYRVPPLSPVNLLRYIKQVNVFLDEHKEYNIVHSHISELGYVFLRLAKSHNIPIRISHSHNAPNFSKLSLKEQIRRGMRWALKFDIVNVATHLFACSTNSGLWLYGNENKAKFIIMNNAVDAQKFAFSETIREQKRTLLGLTFNFVIGHVGRFNEQKNHFFLLDIFRSVLQQKSNAKLVLVGDGILEARVKNKATQLGISEHVLFLGSRNDVHELVSAFDVFLLPSLFEGLPVVLVEAQASGLNCFSSKDTVTDETNIIKLVEYISLKESADIWADKILARPYNTIREASANEVAKVGWDIKTNVEWLVSFYTNALNQTAPPL